MSIFKIQIKPGTPATFDPKVQTVYVNDSVFWFNGDSQAHWPAPSFDDKTGFMEFQIPPNNPSSQVSFQSPQKIPYVCVNHRGESGTIIVLPGKKTAFGDKTKKGAFGGKTKKGAFGNLTLKGVLGTITKKSALASTTLKGVLGKK